MSRKTEKAPVYREDLGYGTVLLSFLIIYENDNKSRQK